MDRRYVHQAKSAALHLSMCKLPVEHTGRRRRRGRPGWLAGVSSAERRLGAEMCSTDDD